MSTRATRRLSPVHPSFEAIVELAQEAAAGKPVNILTPRLPSLVEQAPAAPPPAPADTWSNALVELVQLVRTRRSWVAAMFLIGTADMVVNIVNLVQMSSDELNYGLVIGPPTFGLWISLCVFTVFGTLFYIPETINTFSALYR